MKKIITLILVIVALLSATVLTACRNSSVYEYDRYSSSIESGSSVEVYYSNVSLNSNDVEKTCSDLTDLCVGSLGGKTVAMDKSKNKEGTTRAYVDFILPVAKYDEYESAIKELEGVEFNYEDVKMTARENNTVSMTSRKEFLEARVEELGELYNDTEKTTGEAQSEILRELQSIREELLNIDAKIENENKAENYFTARFSIYKSYETEEDYSFVGGIVIMLVIMALIVVLIVLVVKMREYKNKYEALKAQERK